METINMIHRVLGETLSGIAIIGFVIALFAKAPVSGARQATNVFLRLFAMVLSLQWLLGAITYIWLYNRGHTASLWHPLIMTVILALAHIFSGKAKKGEVSYGTLLVVMAIMAVGVLFGLGRLGVGIF